MMTETGIKHEIMLALANHGCKVFNRPTGKFYTKHADGYKPIKINVKGAADLQGHRPDGMCFYIECKTPDEKTSLMSRLRRDNPTEHDVDQTKFINQMRKSGALAGFASSVEEALAIVGIQP